MLSRLAPVLVASALIAPSSQAQYTPIDTCGTLVRQVACIYFVTDAGQWTRTAVPPGFNVGDRVRVVGMLGPICISPCPLIIGCIDTATMTACTPPPPTCPVDFNNSGSVTVQDIFDFLSAYFNNDIAADFNDSTSVTVQDIFDFLSAYFVGCP